MTQPTIESILQENRSFPPSAEFASQAAVKSLDAYKQLYAAAQADPTGFWADQATKELHWFKPWDTVLDWSNPPFAKWFDGGKINHSPTIRHCP